MSLPITTEPTASNAGAAMGLLQVAREYHLTAYDTVYLQLAMRRECPLATLDQRLRQAAQRANIELLNLRRQ